MNQEELQRLQEDSRRRVLLEFGSDPARAEEREAGRAHDREQRLLDMMNDAAFWGPMKSYLALAARSVAIWIAVLWANAQ